MAETTHGLEPIPSRDEENEKETKHHVRLSIVTTGGFRYTFRIKPLTDNEIDQLVADLNDPNKTVLFREYTEQPYRKGGEKYYPWTSLNKSNLAYTTIERYKPK